MKRSGLFILFVTALLMAHSQRTSYQYMLNPLALNAGFTGYHDVLSATSQIRFQTLGVAGSPQTQSFGVHSPLMAKRAAVGLQFWNESIGTTSQMSVMGAYAYRINTGKFKISMGLQAGVKRAETMLTTLHTRQGADPVFSNNYRGTSPSIGSGILVYAADFYGGFSVPEIFKDERYAIGQRPMILMGGYAFPLGNRLKLRSNALVRMVDAKIVEASLNGILDIDDVAGVGLSYSISGVAVALFRINFTDKIRFAYSSEFLLRQGINSNVGSHEVGLQYLFYRTRKNLQSPRYF
ncbi:MAG: PorP/SprF family type IX secretion system membrane protein [Cyclobacteriaceae bacterium]